MRTKYTNEFKKQAIELAAQVGLSKAAKDLGVSDTNLYKWRKDFSGTVSEQEKVKISDKELEELKTLRKENSELKKVNYILKSAAAFFSQDHLK
jgi:transposase